MTNPKRLGNTVFSSNDPLDDLRPTRQKKLGSLAGAEPEEAPATIVDTPLPSANGPATAELDSEAIPEGEGTDEAEEILRPTAEQEHAKPTPKKAQESHAQSAAEHPLHGKVRFS